MPQERILVLISDNKVKVLDHAAQTGLKSAAGYCTLNKLDFHLMFSLTINVTKT